MGEPPQRASNKTGKYSNPWRGLGTLFKTLTDVVSSTDAVREPGSDASTACSRVPLAGPGIAPPDAESREGLVKGWGPRAGIGRLEWR